MCGLIGGHAQQFDLSLIRHRGPDSEGQTQVNGWTLGHTRLSIQDVSDAASQPFTHGSVTVTYNGELWNTAELRRTLDGSWQTSGDTEVVARALSAHSVNALRMFRGMFALAWVDNTGDLYLARDPYGEVPLHYGFDRHNNLMWCSEIAPLITNNIIPSSIRWVAPGSVLHVHDGQLIERRWFTLPEPDNTPVVDLLAAGVQDRQISDVPVALLMSGGLDSSAIASLCTLKSPVAYTAVHHANSNDRKFARLVSARLGINLIEVPVPPPTADDLNRVVQIIEMPHKAQVEIAWACLHLAERIRSDGYKVVLSGEGSDELLGSYGMAYHGIKKHGWRTFREQSFTGQHRKNFARTNKIFMRHGIEARLPFLHPPLVSRLLSMPQHEVTMNKRHPKAVLASAVEDRIGTDAAWRTKAAFQTDARIDRSAAAIINNPAAHYKTAYTTAFQGVKP